MRCCCPAPNIRPALHRHRHLLPRLADSARIHHLVTVPSSLATVALREGKSIVLSSFAKPDGRHRAAAGSNSISLVTSRQAAPEQKSCEKGGALPSSTSAAAAASRDAYNTSSSRRLALAAATLGIAAAVFMAGADGQKALALGPEGPLVEEFWDNMRRYGVYVLTVSTGAIYTILEPIVELFKNPISAILLLVLLGGSFYVLSQVLTFMVGINEFSYDYAS